MKKLKRLSLRLLAALLAALIFCGASPVASLVDEESASEREDAAPVLTEELASGDAEETAVAVLGDAVSAESFYFDASEAGSEPDSAAVQSTDGAVYEVPFEGSLLRIGFKKQNGNTTHAGTYHRIENAALELSSGLAVLEAYWVDNARGNDYVIPELTVLPTLEVGQRLAIYGLSENDAGGFNLYDYPVLDYMNVADSAMLPLSWYSGFALVLVSDYVEDEIVISSLEGTEASFEGLLPVDASVEIEELAYDAVDGCETVMAFDISILDREGETWQPLDGSPVTVTLRDERIASALAEAKYLRVLHVKDAENGVVEEAAVLSAEGDTLVFEATGFSDYVVQIVLEKTLVASDGNTYKISVTYTTDSGLPEDAELQVSEVTGTEEELAEYVSETAEALYLSPEDLGYTKLFDISIVDKVGVEHQPNRDVSVTVELLDAAAEDTEDLRVVHFGEENKELEATMEGSALSFTTDGFSIFSFTDVSLLQRIIQAVLGKSDNVLYENDDIILSGRMPLLGQVVAEPVTVEIDGKPALVAYDIKIYSNPVAKLLGITWQPTAGAVTVQVKSDAFTGAGNELYVYHLENENAAPELVTAAALTDGWVAFDAESFSVYAFTHVIEKVITAEDGSSYRITVSYEDDAQLPADADLLVTELLDGETYAAYMDRTAFAVGAASFDYARLFDITIVDGEGNELQPAAPVDVKIELLDLDGASEPFAVFHFADEADEGSPVPSVTSGNAVSFMADGFSAYAVVPGPTPPDPQTVQSLEELSENYNDPETGGKGFFISYFANGVTLYTTDSLNGSSAFKETDTVYGATRWYFESAGEENTYYIYTMSSGSPLYMRNTSGNNNMGLTDNLSQAAKFVLTPAGNGKFYFKLSTANRWFQHSKSGNGMRLYTDNTNPANSQLILTYAETAVIQDVYYDGKTYGLMFWNGGAAGKAMMAESSVAGALDAKALIVMSHAGNNSDKLFVPNDSEITMWHFEYVESDEYYLKAEVNGSWKYLEVTPSGMALVDTPDDDCKLHLTVGIGEHGGQICLSSERDATVTYSGNVDTGFVVGNTVGSEWLYLVELSELTSDYLRTYAAEKVSVSDPSVGNGSRVIVYARTWNETKKKYEFYAIDHDGSLQPVYESGNDVEWVGSSLNTMLWNLVEYYWEGTNDPNGYYELYNQYSERYIAPQITDGQILSPDVIGINMPGRVDGYYYSKIIAWDDENYAYVGLKAERVGNKMRIVSCPMEEADDFYFAIVQDIQVDDELTTVPTVDHEQYGITMKLVNMDSREDMSNFLGSAVGGAVTTTVPGLLSTNLVDGYPTVSKGSHRGESLGNLYALGQVRTVNHLFIQSTYSGTGYYEFDSAQNYASLDWETNTFTVYKEIGTHDASSKPTLGHGQFFPFNNIEAGVFAAVNRQNLYDVHGHLLPDSDPRKYEQLYLIKNPDYYFIAELEAAFTQTPNGHDAWGHDIIYEFTGDDDFWLYVDGELVIDLGGIHSALPGSVNFATGDVTVNGKHMLLKNVFYNNYKNRGHTDAQAQAYVNGLFHQNDDGNWVFKDNTSHTMKIFYMERGAGASNLHMRFNLASVKPGTVELSKTLSQENANDELNDSVFAEYLYQVRYHLRNLQTVHLHPSGTPSEAVTWSSAKTEIATVDNTGLVNAVSEGNTVITAEYGGVSESFLVDIRTVDSQYYIAVYQNGTLLSEYVDTNEHLLGAESGEENRVKYKNSTTNVPYSASFTIPGTALSYDHVFKLKPGQTAVITLPENTADYSIVECGVNTNVYSSVKANGAALAGEATTEENRKNYATAWKSSDAVPGVLFDNTIRELRNLEIQKLLYDVNGQLLTTEAAEFTFRLYLASEYDDNDALNARAASMQPYYVKDSAGNYCRWDANSQQFVSLNKTDFSSLTAAEKTAAMFHTSLNGSISKIRSEYRVEVRGLLPGTRFRVEERPTDIPDGYSFLMYDIYPSAASQVDRAGVPGIVGTVIAGTDYSMQVKNIKGFGLRVNKTWTDASFMQSRASVYFGVFTDDGAGNLALVPDSLKCMPYGSQQTLYWYYEKLPVAAVTEFSRYLICEVTLTDPVIGDDNVVSGYSGLTVLGPNDTLTLSGRQKGDNADDSYVYTVLYDAVVTSPDNNVRLFPVTNDRPSIRIFKTDWNGNPLPNAVFRLADSNDVEIGVFSSDADGLVTLVFLGSNKTYTLTETVSPRGYSAMTVPLTIKIAGENVEISGPDSEEYTLDVTATPKSLTIKNRAITLQTVKMGEDDLGAPIPLAGVEFALYKQKTVGNVTGFDVEPEHGYETLLTNADGIIPGVDQTLPPGTYKLHEKAAPNGYKKIGDIIFTITATGVITLDNAQTGVMLTDVLSQSGDTRAYTLTVRNERIPPAPTDVRMRVAPFICIGLIGLLCAALTLPALRRRRRKGGEGHE